MSGHTNNPGVSVAICCYNSAEVLPRTLEHLARQQRPGVPWEVLVIDNASTDDTSAIARGSWPEDAPAPLRIVDEPQSGTRFARERAIRESAYDLIAFIDDDNWVSPNWVQGMADAMAAHPEAGACGGRSTPAFEVPPPDWFEKVKVKWAISSDQWEAGDITDTRGGLFSAGCTFRKAALEQIFRQRFEPLATGSKGSQTIGSEDTELCYLLRLAGWRLWYEPSLTFQHYIRTSRLTWTYARRLFRGYGYGDAHTDAYVQVLRGSRSRLEQTWAYQLARTASFLCRRPDRLLKTLVRPCEGDLAALRTEIYLGRLRALLDTRNRYSRNFDQVEWLASQLKHQQGAAQ